MTDARQELPHDLEEMPAGPRLAVVLASVDRRLLDDQDRIRLLQARHRMAAHVQGELYAWCRWREVGWPSPAGG